MSKLPERITQADDIVAQAKQYAGAPEMERLAIATALIGKSRQEWRGNEEEIFKAIGYRNSDEYWNVATSEEMEARSFAHLLALHLLDPTERVTNEVDNRTRIQQQIEAALRLGVRTDEEWIKRDALAPSSSDYRLKDFMLKPRAAAKWLLSLPKRRRLVPPSLRAFLERSEAVPTSRRQRDRRLKRVPPELEESIKQASRKALQTEGRDDVIRSTVKQYNITRDLARALVPVGRGRGQKIDQPKSAK